MTQTEVKTAHFVIEGGAFTRIARDMVLSERPAQAWRLLANHLVFPNGKRAGAETFAAAVLDGDKKLVGDSDKGIRVKKDNAKGYKKELTYIYAGRVRIDRAWYRPKAVVVDFGPDDASYASRRDRVMDEPEEFTSIAEGSQAMKRFARARVEFYASEGERVVELEMKGKRTFLIFEPCSEPPFWWDENTTPEQALKQFLDAGRRLTEESWTARFGEEAAAQDGIEREIPSPQQEVSEAFQAAFQEMEDARKEQEWKDKLEAIKTKVLVQAKGDLFDLTLKSGEVVKVARAPFENWALRRTSLRHLAAPWEAVSPSGMKLPMDDEFHTDWLLGAGRDLRDAYNGELAEAANHEMYELQRRLGDFECGVIVGGRIVTGIVGKNVLVVPDLHPDRLEAMMAAEAVITEAGGKAAHLAQVALEKSKPILLVPDAVRRLPPGTKLTLYPDEGRVDVVVHDLKRSGEPEDDE